MKFTIYSRYIKHGTLQGKFEWRWRLKGRNGKIIAASSESFSSKHAARNNAKLTRDRLATITKRQWDQA